jgi:hypothetical protein
MNNRDVVKLLLTANRTYAFEQATIRILEKATPRGFKVKLDSHSTADHCSIYLTMDDEPDLLVWYKTNWCSSSYEFNEEGKTIGLQKGCEFIKPQLDAFIDIVRHEISEKSKEFERQLEDKEKTKSEEKDMHIDKYRTAFSGITQSH